MHGLTMLVCLLSVLSMVGLLLIALGTGGIKPCVAAFGGDQFQDHQVSRITQYSENNTATVSVCLSLSVGRYFLTTTAKSCHVNLEMKNM